MIRITRAVLMLSFLLLLCSGSIGDEGEARKAHGAFTGEMKSVIYVRDVQASAPFYRDVLGFDHEGFAGDEKDPYYAEMSAAGVKFGLHEPTSASHGPKVGNLRLYFRVKDLSAHRSRVLAWGKDAGEIRETDWMDLFIARDPDGNEIVFAVTDPERHPIYPWNTTVPAGTKKKVP